MGCHVTLPY